MLHADSAQFIYVIMLYSGIYIKKQPGNEFFLNIHIIIKK
jgi:hypothetical protein